ncbi:hypothetical protein FQK07_03130 [Synechococcus sp. BSF8S]|uniref:hypothetical protein n=1 Tax=Synechococcales TaxID=1890424 RepID=UPI001624AABB|nr:MULTISPECIES: hypothetical protein [unclassified Synechococcus]MBC1260271.1 hypothetical protein [Synechococcus sp. BSF8S]MBC1262912.1 hypothetical protein [Synechococcus sp. BSA11S]
MSFDAHSLERLRELGRQLPQPLPAPEPTPSAGAKPRASEKRHTVELERDPEQLFRELMKVSPDGTVPPHLMDRLRSLEESRLAQQARERRAPSSGQSAAPAAEATRRPGPGRSTTPRADPRLAAEHPDLYTAFHSLLLEDEEDD